MPLPHQLPSRSMPYWRQIHSTAMGGNNWVRGDTPISVRTDSFFASQRRKVRVLTPAARANSLLK